MFLDLAVSFDVSASAVKSHRYIYTTTGITVLHAYSGNVCISLGLSISMQSVLRGPTQPLEQELSHIASSHS